LHAHKSKRGRPRKKTLSKKAHDTDCRLRQTTSSEEFEVTGVTLDRRFQFQECGKNVTSKTKNVMEIIEKLDGVDRVISCQTMMQFDISCVRLISNYASSVWYKKLTGQWKDETQKVQNTVLCKILGELWFLLVKTMPHDAETLLVSILMEKIHDRFAIRDIPPVSPMNHVWKIANCSKPADIVLERLFVRVKLINGIDDSRYWKKHPPWK